MRPWAASSLAVSAVLVSACVHEEKVARHTDVGRNEPALARAIAWAVGAAPEARRYQLEVGGAPPSPALLREAAGASGLSIEGNELTRPSSTAGAAARISLQATRPVWSERGEASVQVSYQVDQGPRVPCVVRVRPPTISNRDWGLSSPSGAECQPRQATR
jgi:hypothetical protein